MRYEQRCPDEDDLEAEGCSLRYVEKDGRNEEYGNCEDGGNGPRNGVREISVLKPRPSLTRLYWNLFGS